MQTTRNTLATASRKGNAFTARSVVYHDRLLEYMKRNDTSGWKQKRLCQAFLLHQDMDQDDDYNQEIFDQMIMDMEEGDHIYRDSEGCIRLYENPGSGSTGNAGSGDDRVSLRVFELFDSMTHRLIETMQCALQREGVPVNSGGRFVPSPSNKDVVQRVRFSTIKQNRHVSIAEPPIEHNTFETETTQTEMTKVASNRKADRGNGRKMIRIVSPRKMSHGTGQRTDNTGNSCFSNAEWYRWLGVLSLLAVAAVVLIVWFGPADND